MAELDALIQAAGQGERLGLGPKAFVQLQGATLLEWAVRSARSFAARVIVAVPAECVRAAERLMPAGVVVIHGGATRPETLRALVEAGRTERVLLHDVAHPLASRADFERVIAAAGAAGAACIATQVQGSVRPVRGDFLGDAVPGPLWVALKPAILPRAALLAAPTVNRAQAAMDLVRASGVEVAPVPTSRRNIKITDRADLDLAELLCDPWPGWD